MNRLRPSDLASLLRRRIQWGTHSGLVKPGDRLPSLRAAANEFGVDQRSVLSAYRELETEGLVVLRPRSGIYVAGDRSPANQVPGPARWMADMFLLGFARGVPPVALGKRLVTAITDTPITAACVECNADQILWIAGQLRHEFGMSTTWVETDRLGTDEANDRLANADLIVTTCFHAAEARALGEQFDRPVVVVRGNRDQFAQFRAELGRGPVYFIGTDERYIKKLLEATDSARWMSNLRPVVADRLASTPIPDNAPVVVTQAAAELLGPRVPQGAVVLEYPFSHESRADILAIMLDAYLRRASVTESDAG